MRRVGILAILLVSACAHVDTGQTDYRVADPMTADATVSPRLCNSAPCPFHATLDRKYALASTPFVATNVYSVELEQAFIGSNLLEGVIFNHQFGKHGEYAILANAFEFAADETSKFIQSPEYGGELPSENNTKLKLVYFGDDIAKFQPFNFSNIPLMPRKEYGGGSVGIQIVVMEIDAQSGPFKALLGTLAEFGKSAIPGPPQATKILFDLGDSLLKGSQDDRLFDYRFVLSNGGSVASDGSLAPAATFAPGRYIFRRRDDRATPMDWSNLTFDHNTGRLYRDGVEVRDEFYLVLNIRKYADGTGAETITLSDWTDFRGVVQKAADARGEPLERLQENTLALLGYRRSRQWKAVLAKRWNVVAAALRVYSSGTVRVADDADLSSCPADLTRANLARDLAERSVQDAVRAFLADYQAAQGKVGEGGAPEAEFKPDDREALVSMVARTFMPWESEEAKAPFADAASFEGTYVASGASSLTALATAAAAGRTRIVANCEQIRGALKG